MTLHRVTSICCAVLFALFSGAVLASSQAREQVTVQLKWYHQFQFAGFYAAKKLGYYRDVGLDVTINERDFETSVLDVVLYQFD